MKKCVVVGIVLFLMLAAGNGTSMAQTGLQVTNTAGETLGDFVGVYDRAGAWVVYSPVMERLMVFDSSSGSLAIYPEGCPYFEPGDCPAVDPKLEDDWWRWVTQCNNRFWVSLDEMSSWGGTRHSNWTIRATATGRIVPRPGKLKRSWSPTSRSSSVSDLSSWVLAGQRRPPSPCQLSPQQVSSSLPSWWQLVGIC